MLGLIGGFAIGVAVNRALEDARGERNLGLGRLQDRLSARTGPGGERPAEIAVIGIFGFAADRALLRIRAAILRGRSPGGGET